MTNDKRRLGRDAYRKSHRGVHFVWSEDNKFERLKYHCGAGKMIKIVPDCQNIVQVNQEFRNLQIFINDVYRTTNTGLIGTLFSLLEPSNSLIISNQHDTDGDKMNAKMSPEEASWDILREDYIPPTHHKWQNGPRRKLKFSSNCHTIEQLYQNESGFVNQVLDGYLKYKTINPNEFKKKQEKAKEKDKEKDGEIEMEKEAADEEKMLLRICSRASQYGYKINELKEIAQNKMREAIRNGDDEKNSRIDYKTMTIEEKDITIDYDTWRADVAIKESGEKRRGTVRSIASFKIKKEKLILSNHHYYHTLEEQPCKLDYNIEFYRKQLNYPKLYNIDYNSIENEYKHSHLDELETVQLSEINLNNGQMDPEMVSTSYYGEKCPQRDYYGGLEEFYFKRAWRFCAWRDGIDYSIKRINIQDYELYNPNWHEQKPTSINTWNLIHSRHELWNEHPKEYYDNQDQPVKLLFNYDRMYSLKLDATIEKWYKNGKYLLYNVLPHDSQVDKGLMVDFFHFQILYHRLLMLHLYYTKYLNKNLDAFKFMRDEDFEKYVWIALNDVSRYCKDEFYKQAQKHQQWHNYDCDLARNMWSKRATWNDTFDCIY